jgi:crossover junction endodeoxyribonuclease RusA
MVSVPVAVPALDVITLNARAHWTANHRAAAALRLRGGWAARIAHAPEMVRADLTVWVVYPVRVNRRRDVSNYLGTVKPLLDGMVDAGVLPDDDDDHLTGPDLRPYAGGAIEELDALVAAHLAADLARPGSWLGFMFRFYGPVRS